MREIKNYIKRFCDGKACFVFPSNIVAREWLNRALDICELETLPMDCFIVWDNFKEWFLTSDVGKAEPVSSIVRKLFADDLMKKNVSAFKDGKALLKYYIPKEYAQNSAVFADWVAGILPQLDHWERRVAKNAGKSLNSDENEDLLFIKKSYENFLNEYGLYEPSWFSYSFSGGDRKFFIMFPELINDFSEYAELISKEPNIEVVRIPEKLKSGFNVLEFQDSRQEIDYCVSKIEGLLESGVSPDEIAVNVCNIEELTPYIIQEFELRGLPYSFRTGTGLGNYAAGQLFSLVADVVESNWQFSSVKALLLNPHFPWKHPEKIKALIQFGVENNCYSSWQENGRILNVWQEAFKINESAKEKFEFEIQSWFEKLYELVEAMVSAPTFYKIQTAYLTFRDTFFITENFTESDDLVVARCVETLGSLIDFEKRFMNIMPVNRFKFFVSILEDEHYVFQKEKNGINIFPFRVAAGTPYAHQFVLNMSQDFATVIYPKLSFLRKDKRELLGAVDENVSTSFFAAYYDCEHPYFSYSKKTFSDYVICHSELTKVALAESDAEVFAHNSFSAEKELFMKDKSMPASIYEIQKIGTDNFLSNFRIKTNGRQEFSFIYNSFGDKSDLLNNALKGFYNDGHIRVSASTLRQYHSCATSWFLDRLLCVQEFFSSPSIFNTRILGTLYHAVFEQLYKEISAKDTVFKAENYELYKKWAVDIVEEKTGNLKELRGTLAKPFIPLFKKQVLEAVNAMLEHDSEMIDGHYFPLLEDEVRCIHNDALYHGYVDRLSCSQDRTETVLVDYKTNVTPNKNDCIINYPDEALNDFQMAMYVFLIENGFFKDDETITEALFWSLKKKKETKIIGTGEKDFQRESFETTLEGLHSYVQVFKDRMANKDFSKQEDVEWGDCANCVFKKVCRTNFTVEGK